MINPKDPVNYASRCHIRKMLNDYRVAIANYRTTVGINPQDDVAYNNRGASKEALKECKGVIADYKKVKN